MKTFFDLIKKIEANYLEENFLALMQSGSLQKLYYKDILEYINNIASFLNINGFKNQEKAIIMLDSSPYWVCCDLAILKSGGVSVPMFANLSFDNMVYQFANCEAKIIFLQDESVFDVVKKTKHKFDLIISIKPFSFDTIEKNPEYKFFSLEEVLKKGAESKSFTSANLLQISKEVNENDIATIIYTSGTSGRPKGVELTHKNLISQLEAIDVGYDGILNSKEDNIFSFLPLAHIFQRTVTYYFLSKCVIFYFSNDVKTIADDIGRVKPTAVTVVPRFLEKVKNGLNEKVKNESFIKKIIGRICYNYAINHEPTTPHSIFYKLYDKLMYSKLREKLGGKIKVMICGGASLPDEVYRFFINTGIPLYQGYGLTETSPVVAVNTPAENKIYTIGKVIKGVEVKLTPEKELLVKGPNVMKGYHKVENSGARVIDENGFLYTGDLAEIDSEGYIKIIGRKKEQFKTSNGKFVNPLKIESMLNSIPYIETSCVIAEGKPFVTVILFPNDAGVNKLNEVELSLPQYIRQINEQLEKHENIHYFYLNLKPATIEGGLITPSMKIVRTAIAEQFKKTIEDFYSRTN